MKIAKRPIVCMLLCLVMLTSRAQQAPAVKYELVTLNGDIPIKLELAYIPGTVKNYSAILMLGDLKPDGKNFQLPEWSKNLINEGYMLAAFSAARPPDADSSRRPQWLFFDQRFAHTYVAGGLFAPQDAGRVIDYLQAKGLANKFGWIGSSSTGIPGLAVATAEPRLGAVVAFVSTGAYRQWLESWHTNGLWLGKTNQLWPETEALLNKVDPILHVNTLFPCAVLMVSGGADKIVDVKTARAFTNAAKPFYVSDPERLRLVIYDDYGHNLPHDVVTMYAENWFRLYLNPDKAAPKPEAAVKDLNESVKRSSVTGADHKKVMQGD
ncbi:MAG: alpha/beta hydrolase [Sphingobacteriaceae bacterium]|nr:MAG: alpha/beta hydrolase [Sphingobacteriaceae bacterium]